MQTFMPGDKLPNIALPDGAGTLRIFYNELKGGPIVLIVGKAAGEPACAAALEAFAAARPALAAFKAELFAVVGGPAPAQRPEGILWFADERGEAAPHLLGPGGAPRVYLLDPNQRILAVLDALAGDALVQATAAALRRWREAEAEARLLDNAAPALVLPSLFDPALCESLMAAWRDRGHQEGGLSNGQVNVYAPDAKKNREHIVTEPDLARTISRTLARRCAPELAKVFNYTARFRFEPHNVLCYEAGRGDFFALHRDNLRPTSPRRFALSLNLNEGYEGGALCFPEYGPHLYRPRAGGGVLFSCNLLHEARPVTRGTRFVLVTFFCDIEQPGNN